MSEREYFLGISYFMEIGPVRFKLLFDFFGSAERIWEADKGELINTGLNRNLVERFAVFRKNFDFEKILLEMSKKEIKFLTLNDKGYPALLKEIPDPPIVLYVKGNLPLDYARGKGDLTKAIGVVGTRKMTVYGARATEKITRDLVLDGVTVISGMARGIDSVAHRSALENNGRTVAVLGTGVDVIYPYENRGLYFNILKHGAIVSEVAPGRLVEKGAFRLRNRIISGLSKGIVVVEGAKESGSLITARYALDQGREVFAVPGPITSKMSSGPAYLISQGAKLVTNGKEVIDELSWGIC